MNMKSFCVRTTGFVLTLIFLLQPFSAYALISNGANAIDQLGQYTDYTKTTVSYEKTGTYDSPNEIGFNRPWGFAMDTIGHRLFVSDRSANRVVVFNLDSSNLLIDKIPDYVLGQNDFISSNATNTQSGLNLPSGLAYAASSSQLFVAEVGGNRVKIFDVSDITNGEPAINVLGQVDFTSAVSTSTQTGMSTPYDVEYDAVNTRLFVAERTGGNKVKIYDVSTITDGEPAINVLGQNTFTGSTGANTQSGLNAPQGLAYDPILSRLFVSENANRIKVFDVATTSNGEPAINILGQTSYIASGATTSKGGVNSPEGLEYDVANARLYVGDTNGNRVKVFDVASITNGEDAINVLGQPDFTTTTATDTQSGLSGPYGLLYDAANLRLFVAERDFARVKIFDVATITDGENAVDLIGQYTDSFNFIPAYGKSGIFNSPNEMGFGQAASVVIDYSNHRLFISEALGNRVLVYNLTVSNVLIDKIPDYVLGQPDFNSSLAANSQVGLKGPRGLVLDQTNFRLFVAERDGNRVKVFDVADITNGEPAINILGQADFISATATSTQSGMNGPTGVEYDSANGRLFVVEQNGSRVKVFDITTITDGEAAINILGQSDYSGSSPVYSRSGIASAREAAYDSARSLLFVSEQLGNSVKVFDVATIVDGEDAIHILGQSDYTSSSSANTQSGLNSPLGITYDAQNSRLFVVENGGNRIKVFDVATIDDGEDAVNIIGQADFTSSGVGNSPSGINGPASALYDTQNGILYVAEGSAANRVKIFDASVPAPVVVATSTPATVKTGFQGPTGYGGSSSSYIPSVNEVITPTLPSIPQAPTSFTFTKTLQSGMTNPEVKTLQQYLNTKGFTVAKTGAGSVGKETNFFGAATKAALIKFQKANKISPAVGFFGPVTRVFILSK